MIINIYAWVVVTVGKKSAAIKLVKRKPLLAVNQYAYRLVIPVDLSKWTDRVFEVKMSEVLPPEVSQSVEAGFSITKNTAGKVLDRITS